MSSHFFALPVTSGEAFLLETPDQAGAVKRILVDGGRRCSSTQALSDAIDDALSNSASAKAIDIAICTHNDIDHAGGLCSFFDHWMGQRKNRIGEVWLPGRWLEIVKRGVLDPEGYARALQEDFERITDESGGGGAAFRVQLMAECETLFESDGGAGAEDVTLGEPDDTGDGWPFDEAQRGALREQIRTGAAPSSVFAAMMQAGPQRRQLTRYITAGRNILEIAEQAVHHGVPVRWFEAAPVLYGGKPARGGVAGLIEPVSAILASLNTKWSPQRLSKPLVNLELTIQNVESLVFYRPETDDEPGVLFCGDSRLAPGVEGPRCPPLALPTAKPKRPIIVTTPHHGSKTNDIAHEIIGRWLKGRAGSHSILIRHGGHSIRLTDHVRFDPSKTPPLAGVQFLYCTRCKECGRRRAIGVDLAATSGNWVPPSYSGCPQRWAIGAQKHRHRRSAGRKLLVRNPK